MPDMKSISEEAQETIGLPDTGDAANAAEAVLAAEEPSPHTITVDGKTREVSLDEMKTLAQKGASADERFRAANALNKEAEADKAAATHHKEMVDTVKAAQKQGPGQADALRKLATDFPEFGVTMEDAEKVIDYLDGSANEGTEEQTPTGPPAFEQMPERVRQSVEAQEATTRQAHLTQIRGTLSQALDSDDTLSTILHGKRADSRREKLTDFALSVLSRKVTAAGRYSNEALRSAVEETRQHATDLGLLDVDTSAPSSPLGLNRAPTQPFGTLRKPGEKPAQISPDKALNTTDYANNVLERMQFNEQQLGSE